MNLRELNTQALAGHADALNVIGLEGGDYVLEARCQGRAHPLTDSQGERLKVHSLTEARELLSGLPEMPAHVVHWSVQDEMCGMADVAAEDLKVPVSHRQAR